MKVWQRSTFGGSKAVSGTHNTELDHKTKVHAKTHAACVTVKAPLGLDNPKVEH